MTDTQRLTLVEAKPRGYFPFRKKEPPPDTISVGQATLLVANACIDQMRILPPEYQTKCWDLVEDVLRDSERKRAAYLESNE